MKFLFTTVILTNLQIVKADLIDKIGGIWEGELNNSLSPSTTVRGIQVEVNNGVYAATHYTTTVTATAITVLCNTQLTYQSGNSAGAIFVETIINGTCSTGTIVLAMTSANNELLITRYIDLIGGGPEIIESIGYLACPTCSLKESRTEYDDKNGVVHIPNLDVFDDTGAYSGQTYEADFQLINATPITFELIRGTQK